MPKRGPGNALTKGEIRRYEDLRRLGWSVESCAELLKRGKTTFYNYEKRKRQQAPEPPPAHPRLVAEPRTEEIPVEHISDAVECIICIFKGQDEKSFTYFDRHDIGMVPLMAEVARFLAHVQALDAQRQHEELYEGYEWEHEVRTNPVTTEDVLRAVPVSIARYRAGEPIMGPLGPPRADEWFQRLMDEDPDFQAVADATREARDSDDPETAIKALREQVRNGDFISDDEPDPVTTNGQR